VSLKVRRFPPFSLINTQLKCPFWIDIWFSHYTALVRGINFCTNLIRLRVYHSHLCMSTHPFQGYSASPSLMEVKPTEDVVMLKSAKCIILLNERNKCTSFTVLFKLLFMGFYLHELDPCS